jgi:hypothetical protein
MAPRSEVQKMYADVARLEAALIQVMDNVPAVALTAATAAPLRQAAALLEQAVRLLEGVRDATAPGYEQGPYANSPVSTDMSAAERRRYVCDAASE